MRQLIALFTVIFVASLGSAWANGKGAEIKVGEMATEWDSATVLDPIGGIFPVGGAGQLNGEFTIAERGMVQIGLRATDRTDGLLTASGKRKGTYHAATGYDTGTSNRAEWNYDIHVDLRGSGTTLSDYNLTLTQTFTPKLFGSAGPVDLTFPDALPGILDNAVLHQLSWNPVFFNDEFDVFAEGTYNIVLKLQPKQGGTPLLAHIKVVVSD
ncbi:MAG: hypothetical protein KJO35_10630 [Gammaproteobacteria bacterium]|nr:hypothetical protein [Gammaproteobacteria bacterium]